LQGIVGLWRIVRAGGVFMRKFLRNQITIKNSLVALFIIALIFIFFIKFYWGSVPQKWQFGFVTGDVLFNFWMGYIVSFIFYVLVIWIPEINAKTIINSNIDSRLSRILFGIKYPISSFVEGDFLNLKKEDIFSQFKTIELTDKYPHMIGFNNQEILIADYLLDRMYYVNRHIQQILRLPIMLDPKLVSILDHIENSKYHELLESFNNLRRLGCSMSGEALCEELFSYYKSYFELKNFMKKNRINITIKEENL
jgi:hypothetical protein